MSNQFSSLSERLLSKILSYLALKEGTLRSGGIYEEQATLVTVVKDSLGYFYEVRVTPIGRTKIDRPELGQ